MYNLSQGLIKVISRRIPIRYICTLLLSNYICIYIYVTYVPVIQIQIIILYVEIFVGRSVVT